MKVAELSRSHVTEHAARTVVWANETLALSFGEIGAVVDADERTVRRWKDAEVAPRARHQANLDSLVDLRHLLDEVFETQAEAVAWLHSPLKVFRGHPPVTMLRRGRIKDVAEVLATLESGAFLGATGEALPRRGLAARSRWRRTAAPRLDIEGITGSLEHTAAPYAVPLHRDILDLTHRLTRMRYGISVDELTSDRPGALAYCRSIARRHVLSGDFGAILAPSAALRGGVNLIIYNFRTDHIRELSNGR